MWRGQRARQWQREPLKEIACNEEMQEVEIHKSGHVGLHCLNPVFTLASETLSDRACIQHWSPAAATIGMLLHGSTVSTGVLGIQRKPILSPSRAGGGRRAESPCQQPRTSRRPLPGPLLPTQARFAPISPAPPQPGRASPSVWWLRFLLRPR